jgi:hypothetical protein
LWLFYQFEGRGPVGPVIPILPEQAAGCRKIKIRFDFARLRCSLECSREQRKGPNMIILIALVVVVSTVGSIVMVSGNAQI